MEAYCPICNAPERLRERRINGDSICEEGHKYPSANPLDEPRDETEFVIADMKFNMD